MSTALSVSMDTEKSLLAYTEEVAVRGQNEVQISYIISLEVKPFTFGG